ncbi:hypothetical protein [Ruegeria arenilitoris]|uniref:hypothetical protein n=1 Tax=Ruegeria arenilitoris TaxID=1173585 RepID=UPI00147F15A3|nr:hypothetical protein [Ruegeria arenilitoris]
MTTMNRPATPAARSRATRLIAAGLGAVRAQLRARSDGRRLCNFNDRMLADVGLSSGDFGKRLCRGGMSPTLFY